jgi:hypothetical protein
MKHGLIFMAGVWCAGFLSGMGGVFGADSRLLAKATFARALNADKSPAEVAEGFAPEDVVHLSLELKERPTRGVVTAKFFFRDELINEGRVDLAGRGTPDGAGGPIHVAFSLKPKEPFPVSEQYRVEAMLDETPLGTFRFRIDPPADATPSRVERVVLVKEIPEKIADAGDVVSLAPDEPAILAGVIDAGRLSWLQAEWFINGKRDDGTTQTLAYDENREDANFHFRYLPKGGWKPGRHEAVLLLNGREIARKGFSVRAPIDLNAAEAAMPAPALKSATLHRDDGSGRAGEAVEFFLRGDRILHFICDLENIVTGATGEITWSLVEAEGGLKDIVMARAPLSARTANRLAGRFTASRELPKGRYKVEITSGKKSLASREFEVREE